MKRLLRITIIVICIGLPLLFLWYGCIHPFASRLMFAPNYYDGVSYYQDDSYLEFDNGELFGEFLSGYAVANKSKVVDFHYGDTSVFDNPFYGKFHDIYVADFRCSVKEYEALKETVAQNSIGTITYVDYVLYSLPIEPLSSEDDCYKVIAFCEEANIVRFAMIPDIGRKQAVDENDVFHIIVTYYWHERWEWEYSVN